MVQDKDKILALAGKARTNSSSSELLSSELLPLLDACRFLEKESSTILAPRKLGKDGQPAWLWGVETIVYHEPVGKVLILAPGNYPLFLPMVQALHAWAAGNEVWLKSAPGSLELHQYLHQLFLDSGGRKSAFVLLGEEVEQFEKSLPLVQKVVLVGSVETGRTVLSQAGEALVPVVAELSGWDSVFIHPEADLERAARAVAFGLAINHGRTCVAPRRIFLRGQVERFEKLFLEAVEKRKARPLTEEEARTVAASVAAGAKALQAEENMGPVLLSRVPADHELLSKEQFGALAVLCVVESDQEALELAESCPYALGATIFGPQEWAEPLAHKVPAQVISINDMIVPTADPRVPFGGSGRSGFGRMRGAEGLLEMTQTRTVSVRKSGGLDHLLPPGPLDELIVEKYLVMSHASGVAQKGRAFLELVMGIARERIRKRKLRYRKS